MTDDFDQAAGDEGTLDSLPPAIAQLGVDVQAEYVRARERLGLGEGLGSRGLEVGRYRLEEQIGHGGMGIVYRAHDPELDRPIAIKLVQAKPFAQPDKLRRRLLREAKVLAKLTHPNVVRVYDCGEHDGEVFLAMEFVEGTTLRDWQEGKPRRAVLEAYEKAARGLAAAHELGVIHRDFKPDNVLVANDGRVLVGDFGLAGLVASEPMRGAGVQPAVSASGRMSATRTGSLLGTPMYMAPEQLRGDAATPQSDQFGFCVALWEALTGSRPFEAEQAIVLLQRIEEGRPKAVAEVPRRLRARLLRGLSADPQARFEELSELADRLLPRPRMVVLGSALGLSLVVGLVVGNEMAKEPEPECELAAKAEEVGDLPGWNAIETILSGDLSPYHRRLRRRFDMMEEQAATLCRSVGNVSEMGARDELGRRFEYLESIVTSSWKPKELTSIIMEFDEGAWREPPPRPIAREVTVPLQSARIKQLGGIADAESGYEGTPSEVAEGAVVASGSKDLELAIAKRWKGRFLALEGDHQAAKANFREAVMHADVADYDDARMEARLMMAKTMIMRLGDDVRGLEDLEYAYALMRKHHEPWLSPRRAQYEELLSSVLKQRQDCRLAPALWHQTHALIIRHLSGDLQAQSMGHMNLARVYELCGPSPEQERRHLRIAVELVEKLPGSAERTQAAFAFGHWLAGNGNESEMPLAARFLEEARANPDVESFALSDLIILAVHNGQDKRAVRLGNELQTVLETRPPTLPSKRREAWSIVAMTYALVGNVEAFDGARQRFLQERERDPSVASDRQLIRLDLMAADFLREERPQRARALAKSTLAIAASLPGSGEDEDFIQEAKELIASTEGLEH
ncbi:MAG: serine/threonine-protein kinase [Myxococcota bacterium]